MRVSIIDKVVLFFVLFIFYDILKDKQVVFVATLVNQLVPFSRKMSQANIHCLKYILAFICRGRINKVLVTL